MGLPSGEETRQVVPIGQPIANVQIYLLDAHLNPVPVGVAGELYIAGDGLGRGYLNRPDLTAEKFIPNPFAAATVTVPAHVQAGACTAPATWPAICRMATSNISAASTSRSKFAASASRLGEIEAALAAFPEVREAGRRWPGKTSAGDKRLVAYLVGTDLPETAALRSKLAESLPEYMLPAHFIPLEQLPLTPNGKIDRKALPAPDMTRSQSGYVAPRSELEKIISQIWMDVLRLDKVSVNDNFFDLGGHSLLVARVHARLREQLQRDLKMVTLFQYPTISALASYLNGAETEGSAGTISGSLRAQLRRDLMKRLMMQLLSSDWQGASPTHRIPRPFGKTCARAKRQLLFSLRPSCAPQGWTMNY